MKLIISTFVLSIFFITFHDSFAMDAQHRKIAAITFAREVTCVQPQMAITIRDTVCFELEEEASDKQNCLQALLGFFCIQNQPEEHEL